MSRYSLPGGRIVQSGNPFEHDGVLYPSNWFRCSTPAEREAIGAVEIVEQPRPDERYGYVNEDPANPGAWLFSPFPPEVMQPRLVDYARNKSWAIRSAGMPYGEDKKIGLDADALAMINGMALMAQLDPQRTFNFDTGAGVVPMRATEALSFAGLVGAWVQGTFDKRTEVLAAIQAGTITTYEEVDAAFL